MRKSAVALVPAAVTGATAATSVGGSSSLSPVALSHARTIKAEICARYVRGADEARACVLGKRKR